MWSQILLLPLFILQRLASINVVHLCRLKGHVCQWDHSHYIVRIFEHIKPFNLKGSFYHLSDKFWSFIHRTMNYQNKPKVMYY